MVPKKSKNQKKKIVYFSNQLTQSNKCFLQNKLTNYKQIIKKNPKLVYSKEHLTSQIILL